MERGKLNVYVFHHLDQNCFVTLDSQKETEVKERSVFDIPIFTEEFLNHSKGDYHSIILCYPGLWQGILFLGGIHCSKAMIVIFQILGLVWKKKIVFYSLVKVTNYSKTSEGKLAQCCQNCFSLWIKENKCTSLNSLALELLTWNHVYKWKPTSQIYI